MKKQILLIEAIWLLFMLLTSYVCMGKEDSKQTVNEQKSVTEVESTGKVLVAYFTWPEPDGVDASSGASRVIDNGKLFGNTEYVARMIAQETKGDLFAIQTEKKYPTPHKALIDEAKREAEAGEHPKITSHIKNLKNYDVIFVGYPNWWYDMPMVIYSFFDEYDFKGKTVIPFVTHGGSRFSESVETIKNLEKEANVIEGPSVSGRNVPSAEKSIKNWIEKHGLKK